MKIKVREYGGVVVVECNIFTQFQILFQPLSIHLKIFRLLNLYN